MTARPRVLVCCNSNVRREYATGDAVARLERLADWAWLPSEGTSTRPGMWGGPSEDPAEAERLRETMRDGFEALIVCHGAPYVDAFVLDRAPRLKLIGELEGDRFANRIDVDAAAQRGIRVVDTTHGSSLPVAEWALALMMIGLRNAGEQFRRLIRGEEFRRSFDDPGYRLGELTGRSSSTLRREFTYAKQRSKYGFWARAGRGGQVGRTRERPSHGPVAVRRLNLGGACR